MTTAAFAAEARRLRREGKIDSPEWNALMERWSKEEAKGCEECEFRGWVVMGEENSDAKRIQLCDTCQTFATDEEALAAAHAAGWMAPGCLSCYSPKCGLCGHCHECEDDELRPQCAAELRGAQ